MRRRPLNEGRSLNSGDTSLPGRGLTLVGAAQRRPESELRRHAPGYPLAIEDSDAQRRPESELRRHTPSAPGTIRPRSSPLNEGRSLNSGDTINHWRMVCVRSGAQRRPESELRRHVIQTELDGSDLRAQRRPESELRRHSQRGFTATARVGSAQRRPESELRRHHRTPGDSRRASPSLNEGRSLNSGDTSPWPRRATRTSSAQRRPESELRRHLRTPPQGRKGGRSLNPNFDDRHESTY